MAANACGMDLLCAGRQRPAGCFYSLCTGEALCLSDRAIVCISLPIHTLPVYVETPLPEISDIRTRLYIENACM